MQPRWPGSTLAFSWVAWEGRTNGLGTKLKVLRVHTSTDTASEKLALKVYLSTPRTMVNKTT